MHLWLCEYTCVRTSVVISKMAVKKMAFLVSFKTFSLFVFIFASHFLNATEKYYPTPLFWSEICTLPLLSNYAKFESIGNVF